MNQRRQFLKKSLFLGASNIAIPSILTNVYGTPLIKSSKKVICIGAGLAGLAAAYRLKQMGYEVIIVESRSRIGGRVFSHAVNAKNVIELGAEWIGESHKRVIDLCHEFNLELVDNRFDTHLIYKGKYSAAKKWSYSHDWKLKFDSLLENYRHSSDLDKLKFDQYDWWRFLVNNGCSDFDLDIHELLDSTDFGESIRHVSAGSALEEYAYSSDKNEMDFKIRGGNSRLASKFLERIGDQHILLGHTVARIEQNKKVKVTCTNGKVFEADSIICTIPTLAMRKIEWSPKLPENKINAVNELQYARINKHAVEFKNRFWKDESFDLITDELPHYFYHATKSQLGPQGVLMSYTIGEKAAVFGNSTNKYAANAIIDTLKPHFGDIKRKINSQTNYYWGKDPYSNGAYALYGINQWNSVRPVLTEPFMHTYFAGEHLAEWQGFMEGAIQTGEDAADAVVNR